MIYKDENLAYLFYRIDTREKSIAVLEEERDNYELLLKHFDAYDDNVEVHKFEDVVGRIDKKLNC